MATVRINNAIVKGISSPDSIRRIADEKGLNPQEVFVRLIFEVNGTRSAVKIKNQAVKASGTGSQTVYANSEDPMEIGANIPGNIIKILVSEGEAVKEKQPIAVIEAMKMETNILATADGVIEKILISEGQQVKAGELIAKIAK